MVLPFVSSGFIDNMPRSYVDNAYNRSVGRVGMPVGSCVISRSSGGGSSSRGSSGGGTSAGYSGSSSSRSTGGGSSSSYSSSTKTYVDNAYNRSIGRVGLPLGSMVMSKSSTGSQSLDYSRDSGIGASPKTQSSYSYSSGSDTKTYVDNAYNRSLGRVGMPHGSLVVSKSSSSTSKSSESRSCRTYVDNAFNRSVGRVGLPLGTCRVSRTSRQTQERQRFIEKLQNERVIFIILLCCCAFFF